MHVKSCAMCFAKIYRLTYPPQSCVLKEPALHFPAPAEGWDWEDNYEH